MRGHEVGALPVLDGLELVGMVLNSQVLGRSMDLRVADVMMREVVTIHPDTSIREAAVILSQGGIGRAPVIENGRLIGVLTDGDLLPELGRSYDPLTDLPWSDTLREWAIDRLKVGHELTVLFIDLDRFGQFNKQFGHIVGDQVLASVADVLIRSVDSDIESLCRYGGDEFCIATLRTAEEAQEFAERITRRVSEISIPELEGARISCHIGQWGGKRTKEREHTHYAATLSNLINLASRDCTSNKLKAAKGEGWLIDNGTEERVCRLKLVRVDVRWRGRHAQVEVELDMTGPAACFRESVEIEGPFKATSSLATDEAGAVRLVADTTVSALATLLPPAHSYQISDVLMTQTGGGQSVVTAVGEWAAEQDRLRLAGSAVVSGNAYHAAAAAVLASVNRLLERVLLESLPPMDIRP
jgi:diguanylate cyclase (GGDEF)-like protein